MSNDSETKPGPPGLARWASSNGASMVMPGQQQHSQQFAQQQVPPQQYHPQIPQQPQHQNGEGINPLAALLSALSGATRGNGDAQYQQGARGGADAHFTAQLCSALSLQPDSLLSNFQRSNPAPTTLKDFKEQGSSVDLQQHKLQASPRAGDISCAGACNSVEDAPTEGAEQDTSSNDVGENGSSIRTCRPGSSGQQQPLSEEAKRRRRQEINRESARRVRKRKSIEHQQLQQQVNTLQAQAANAAADQVVIVRYASELTRERDALVQRNSELEAKWVTAECHKVVLRQRIADLMGVTLNEVLETGQPLSP